MSELQPINIVDISQPLIDHLMDTGLRDLGWTEMEVYDSVKHWALKIPTGCDTCPPPERRVQLDPEGKIWPQAKLHDDHQGM